MGKESGGGDRAALASQREHQLDGPTPSREVLSIAVRIIEEDVLSRASWGPCRVDDVLNAGNSVGFVPFTLEQARLKGYDCCAWCFGPMRTSGRRESE